jgi:hypothetical protein
MEETDEDGSSLIAIDKRFDKLLTGLRTAVANEYILSNSIRGVKDNVITKYKYKEGLFCS